MSGSNKQILELYKQGLTAAEIADSLRYEVEAVAFVLTHDQEIQREIEKADCDKLDAEFGALEKLALGAIKDTILYGENEYARDVCRQTIGKSPFPRCKSLGCRASSPPLWARKMSHATMQSSGEPATRSAHLRCATTRSHT